MKKLRYCSCVLTVWLVLGHSLFASEESPNEPPATQVPEETLPLSQTENLLPSPLEAAVEQLKNGDTKQALAIISQFGSDGDVTAQVLLGEIYAIGHFVPQNFQLAARWRSLAAEQGDVVALNALGKHYAEGYGVVADVTKAERYLLAAASSGEASFQYDVGVLYDNPRLSIHSPSTAALWYERAANQGFTAAEASLGMLLFEGSSIEQDLPRAKSLLTKAANAGHVAAQNNLGIMYVRGEGVLQNYEKALYWFREATEQGHKSAMINLSVMYENGLGVAFDEAEAQRLVKLATQQSHNNLVAAIADLQFSYDERLVAPAEMVSIESLQRGASTGDPIAQFQLGWYWLSQAPTPNYILGRQALERAASKGMISAMLNLGLLHLKGQGVPQDFITGYRWINEAAGSNSPNAVKARNALLPFMTPEQLRLAQEAASE